MLTRSFVRGFVVSMLMMVVLTLVVRAQTTQESGIADTASTDTLQRARETLTAAVHVGQALELAPPQVMPDQLDHAVNRFAHNG